MDTTEDKHFQIVERLSTAQAAGGVGSFSIDISDDLVTATAEFSKLYGLGHIPVRPATDFEAVVVADDQSVVSHLSTRREGNAATEVEYRIRRHDDGELRWIARKGEFERDASGSPIRFIGIARDVTSRRLAEDNLRKTQEKLSLALEATGVGTFDYDLVHDVLEWDDRCRELFGLPAETPVSYETFLSGLHPEDRDQIDTAVKAAISADGDGQYDVAYRTVGIVDGVIRWVAAKGRTFLATEEPSDLSVRSGTSRRRGWRRCRTARLKSATDWRAGQPMTRFGTGTFARTTCSGTKRSRKRTAILWRLSAPQENGGSSKSTLRIAAGSTSRSMRPSTDQTRTGAANIASAG